MKANTKNKIHIEYGLEVLNDLIMDQIIVPNDKLEG